MSCLSWEQACRRGDQAQVTLLLQRQDRYALNCGLRWAAEHDHVHLIELLIDKGAKDWDAGLRGAAEGGHLPLMQLFIEKGATRWNWALYGAARGGHMHLVHFLIDRGAQDWNGALWGAAAGNHLHLLQFFIKKGANQWNLALVGAVSGGHLRIVQHLIEQESAPKKWSQACVALLQQHPDAIIALFQRGKVPRERFAQHSAAFEQQILTFLGWQQQVSKYLYDACLLPHVLCAQIVAY
jgi:hypothetical protein